MLRRALVVVVAALVTSAGCKGEFGSPCEKDKDCERGLRCAWVDVLGGSPDLRQCTADCATDDECPDLGVCHSAGDCIRTCDAPQDPCPDGATCNPGAIADGSACVPTCSSSDECTFGACVNGVCKQQ